MRWQQLFADLQAQFEEAEAAAEQAESASRARAEIGALALADRLRVAWVSQVVGCGGAGRWSACWSTWAPDWLLLEDEGAADPGRGVGRDGRSPGWGGAPRGRGGGGGAGPAGPPAGRYAAWRATGARSRSSWTTWSC